MSSMKMDPLLESPRQTRYNRTTSLLVAAQTYRILGVVFLWGVSQGILHPANGIPARVGDILIGATAIPFAYFLSKGFSSRAGNTAAMLLRACYLMLLRASIEMFKITILE